MSSLGTGTPTASLVKLALTKARVALESCERYEKISSILSTLRLQPEDKKYESISAQIASLFDKRALRADVKPVSMTDFDKLMNSEPIGTVPELLKVVGWCKTIRRQSSGRLLFVIVNDGSCKANLQIVVHEGALGHGDASKCTAGSSIRATGIMVARPNVNSAVEAASYESLEDVSNKFELHVSPLQGHSIEVMGPNLDPAKYPIAKKYISNEFLREVAHLRSRSYLISAVMRVRNALAFSTHLYFQKLGCIYFHSPLITTADCEGAGELFQVTTLLEGANTLSDLAKRMGYNSFKEEHPLLFKKDFFKKRAYLTCSGQLSLETYACSMGSGYTFGPTFRAENSHTNRHLAEFWMIEPEFSFTDLRGNMEIAEEYVKFVIRYVLDHCMDDLLYFDKNVDPGLIERLHKVVETRFERITYTDAIDILLQHEQDFKDGLVQVPESDKPRETAFEYPVHWGVDLQSEHERFIAEQVFGKPVILYNYPSKIKAFYMRRNEDGKTCAAMDLIVPKIGELIGGSQREERVDVLLESLNSNNLDPKDYWWYMDLRNYGSIPHSGFGLGFERLIMMVTGVQNIKDVIPFPRSAGNAEF